jgi:hypothetical protein
MLIVCEACRSGRGQYSLWVSRGLVRNRAAFIASRFRAALLIERFGKVMTLNYALQNRRLGSGLHQLIAGEWRCSKPTRPGCIGQKRQ